MTKKEEKTTTYILDLTGGGQRRVTVPSNWKITFGPAVPFTDKQRMHSGGERGYALRFYEGNKENQRMIFTDVITFRDASIPIQEKITKSQQQVMQKSTQAGSKNVVVEAKITEWIDPDNPEKPSEEFLRLPSNGGFNEL